MDPLQLVGWGALAGAAGVTIVNILKNALDLEGTRALLLTYVVSFVLGIGVLALNGELLPLTIDRLAIVVPAVFVTADALYRFIVSKQD